MNARMIFCSEFLFGLILYFGYIQFPFLMNVDYVLFRKKKLVLTGLPFLLLLFQFKRSVHDILKPDHDDFYLVRWLRARKWNTEAAEKMFRDVSCFNKDF